MTSGRSTVTGRLAAAAVAGLVLMSGAVRCAAQGQPPATPAPAPAGAAQPQMPTGVPLPADYVIGPEDVLTVVFWRDKDMSQEVAVRPDGVITLPLIQEVRAVGLTPEELREKLTTEAAKYIQDPNVTVVVKAINSRKVTISGMVGKQGQYPLLSPTTVVELIAMAGGLHEFAHEKDIVIVRTENGKQVTHKFNYKEVSKGEKLQQNILLKPGDIVIVP